MSAQNFRESSSDKSSRKRKPSQSRTTNPEPTTSKPSGRAPQHPARDQHPEINDLFITTFRAAPVGMFLLSLIDKSEIVNSAFCKLLGYTKREMSGLGLRGVIHGDDTDGDFSHFHKMTDGKNDYQTEKRFIHENGQTIRTRLNVSVVKDRRGSPSYVVGQTLDISRLRNPGPSAQSYKSELARQTRYRMIIRKITRAVHRSLKLGDVIRYAVRMMKENIDGADIVAIHMIEGKEAVMRGFSGYEDKYQKKLERIPYPRGFTWKTIIEGKVQYCGDTDTDTVIGPVGREMGTMSYASMPIRDAGKTVGCININSRKKHAFGPEELTLLRTVAQHIELVPVEDDKLELIVKDDGSGFPADYDPESGNTLGLRIVSIFTHQLGGSLEIKRRKKGTEFRIVFAKS